MKTIQFTVHDDKARWVETERTRMGWADDESFLHAAVLALQDQSEADPDEDDQELLAAIDLGLEQCRLGELVPEADVFDKRIRRLEEALAAQQAKEAVS
jgi:hypothetical protein